MAKIKICLDAGHYGKYNRSPAKKEYYESDMAWNLHLLLKKYLEWYGFEVIQTRSTQAKDMDLYSRGKASKGCDLFLSIHSNAVAGGVNESIDYPVVYVPLNGKGNKIGKLLADCIADTMRTKQKGRTATRKGNNGDYYGVIRGAVSVGVPGLIMEHSFHTNTKATEWLLNKNNLDKLAKAEAAVIAAYFGVKAPVVSDSNTASNTVTATDKAKSYMGSLGGTYKVIGCDTLNVRHGAGVAKKLMTTIAKGTKAKCYGYYTTVMGRKWLLIQFTKNGIKYTGFASSKYLKK